MATWFEMNTSMQKHIEIKLNTLANKGKSPTKEITKKALDNVNTIKNEHKLHNMSLLKERGMGWFQVDFSRKGHMSRPKIDIPGGA